MSVRSGHLYTLPGYDTYGAMMILAPGTGDSLVLGTLAKKVLSWSSSSSGRPTYQVPAFVAGRVDMLQAIEMMQSLFG